MYRQTEERTKNISVLYKYLCICIQYSKLRGDGDSLSHPYEDSHVILLSSVCRYILACSNVSPQRIQRQKPSHLPHKLKSGLILSSSHRTADDQLESLGVENMYPTGWNWYICCEFISQIPFRKVRPRGLMSSRVRQCGRVPLTGFKSRVILVTNTDPEHRRHRSETFRIGHAEEHKCQWNGGISRPKVLVLSKYFIPLLELWGRVAVGVTYILWSDS